MSLQVDFVIYFLLYPFYNKIYFKNIQITWYDLQDPYFIFCKFFFKLLKTE